MAIEKTLSGLLTYTIENQGSDLHICPGASPFIRVDGIMKKLEVEPFSPIDIKEIIKETYMLDPDKKKEMYSRGAASAYSFSINGIGRFRACAYSQRGTTAMTIRILPYKLPSIESIGYGERFKERIADFANHKRGLFLLMGMTDSGKSTTLAAIVDYLNEATASHITTIEHPIEYLHMHKNSIVTQKEIGEDVPDLSSAILWAITQNADVIALGDIDRTEKDIMDAVAAAEDKLVFACIKTPTPIENASEFFREVLTHESTQKLKRLSNALKGTIHHYFGGDGGRTVHITENPLVTRI